MALKFRCAHCDEYIITKYSKIGDYVKCLKCRNNMIIPPEASDTDELPRNSIETHVYDALCANDSYRYTGFEQNPTSVYKILFFIQGRINRAKFWFYNVLILNLILTISIIIGSIIDEADGAGTGFIIGFLITLWPMIALNVKRCHDRNRSGLFYLVTFIPILSIWYFVEIFCLRGTEGDNEYGTDPLASPK